MHPAYYSSYGLGILSGVRMSVTGKVVIGYGSATLGGKELFFETRHLGLTIIKDLNL